VKGVRDRHDGIARNPWNEFECGHHYARAMASWSLILALSGFHYSAPEKMIAFGPKVNAADFRSFYSTGTGWGVYSQQLTNSNLVAQIGLRWGELELQRIELDVPSDCPCALARARLAEKDLPLSLTREVDRAIIALREAVKFRAGVVLEVQVS
jgi:non-lysosomal glucosylceramidase